MTVRRAIVVGGGIAGLVAARALALRGVEVTLLERKGDILDEGGIGIGIRSNAMNALGMIGLAEPCIDNGVAADEIVISAANGATITRAPTRRYMDQRWPGFTGLGRAILHGILVDGARGAGVRVLPGVEVTSLAQDDDAIYAYSEDGRRFDADILVGAEGIRSTIRARLFPGFAGPAPTGEGAWRGLIPGVQMDRVELVYGGSVGTVGVTPMRDGVYLYAVDRSANAPPRGATDLPARFVEMLAGYGGFVPELLAKISPNPNHTSYRPLESVLLRAPWYSGRAILIGDSAHAGPPTLAQGAAMGIEDGVVLAECVAAADDPAQAFATFMERRFDRVRTIIEASVTISHAQMTPEGRSQMQAAERAAEATLELAF